LNPFQKIAAYSSEKFFCFFLLAVTVGRINRRLEIQTNPRICFFNYVIGEVANKYFQTGMTRRGKLPMVKRIYAVLIIEVKIDGRAIEIENPRMIDATSAVLNLTLTKLKRLKNRSGSSTALVKFLLPGDTWPYAVEITDQVCEYFNVLSLSEINKDMLHRARNQFKLNSGTVIWVTSKKKK
jgi:hypothetical protein